MVGRKHIKGLVKATLLYMLHAGESTEAIATETSLSRRQIQRYRERFQNTGDPYITPRSQYNAVVLAPWAMEVREVIQGLL